MTDSTTATTTEPRTLDVREDLRNGKEPLPMIMQAIQSLTPGQPLRLLATFEPLPLFAVLARKGYGHYSTHHGEGDWEVLFTPGTANPVPAQTSAPAAAADDSDWPIPTTQLDNRGLEPPEPLVRILDALEHLPGGGVLQAINERDPVFLYPELETRGAAIRTEKQADGSVHILIRRAVTP